jgi:hypothetical protein
MEDEIEILARHVPVRGEQSLFEVLAGAEREAEPIDVRAGARQRSRAPHRAQIVADTEPVPVPAFRIESIHLDVHGMRPCRHRHGPAALDDVRHALVARDLPDDLDGLRRHAAANLERIRCEPRPQDHAVRRRIAGRDAQREHRPSDARAYRQRPRAKRHGRQSENRETASEQRASTDTLIQPGVERSWLHAVLKVMATA